MYVDTLGFKLRKTRKDARIKKKDLASRCGVSHQTVWNWEHNLYVPSIAHLRELSNALGVDFVELVVLSLGK